MTDTAPGTDISGIDHVALRVRDLSGMAAFYQRALGLHLLSSDGTTRVLGTPSQPLMVLHGDAALRPLDRHHAGLFHTAFLLPQRGDLAAWLRHAAQTGVALTGASDHLVSEAVYLDDPEGNGIEVYVDRPADQWPRDGNRVLMQTLRLDLAALDATATAPWQGMPEGASIGHVHLQVGDLTLADRFFRKDLALRQTFDVPGAGWYGWNGYHHQIAGNLWNSRGAGPRDAGMTGLDRIVLRTDARRGLTTPNSQTLQDPYTMQDPWGTVFQIL